MRNISDERCRENQNITLFVQYPFSENRAVYENVRKQSGARQVTDDNTAHAHYMLDN
jgi:hypothetical protein